MRVILLNGFDRSGTSWILRLLGEHPQVRTLFQPFSRTEVHASQYTVWDARHRAPSSEAFLHGLCAGRFDPHYCAADLWSRHSRGWNRSAVTHTVIKDTKLHLKVGWLERCCPRVELWAVERDPRAVLHSLHRNGFDRQWYGWRAYEALAESVRRDPGLACYRSLLGWPGSVREATAWVIAVRSHYFLQRVPSMCRLRYEDLVEDADRALGSFFDRVGLDPVRVGAVSPVDGNVSGLPFAGAQRYLQETRDPVERLREDQLFRSLGLISDRSRFAVPSPALQAKELRP